MISSRDVAMMAEAQRHVPLPESTVEHFARSGIDAADLYGVVQNLVTVFSCDPWVRETSVDRDEGDAGRLIAELLQRLAWNVPRIVDELLADPSLLPYRGRAPRPGVAS